MAVKPSDRGPILKIKPEKHDLYEIAIDGLMYHIQGIVQMDEYIVLSTSANDKALILIHKDKIVDVKDLPQGYEHAGGLDALCFENSENNENEKVWMIVVPVYKGDQGAILRYVLSENENSMELKYYGKVELNTKAYAVGIAQKGDRVVIAAVIHNEGKDVRFFMCCNNEIQEKNKKFKVSFSSTDTKERWTPDNGYPNSISLISHPDGAIYFVGMYVVGEWGIGEDRVDIYELVEENNSHKIRRIGNAHVKCDDEKIDLPLPWWLPTSLPKSSLGPSFRWGGHTRIDGEILQVLAVGRNIVNNEVLYNKFYFTIDKNEDKSTNPSPN